MAEFGGLDWDAMPIAELLEGLDRLEKVRRQATASACDAAAAVDRRDKQSLGAIPHRLIADVLRISPGDAKRRIRLAGQLAPRSTLTGQSLPPGLDPNVLLGAMKEPLRQAIDGKHTPAEAARQMQENLAQ